MSLDERGIKILNLIVENPAITGIQIQEDLNITRKQLSYSLQKINYYLIANGHEEIQRLKTGHFVISDDVRDTYRTSGSELDRKHYVFSEENRIVIIALLLLVYKDALTISDFIYILKVSKNTILSDLKKLQSDYLTQMNLELLYSRTDGYFIQGKEFDKRSLIVRLVSNALSNKYVEELLLKSLNIDDALLEEITNDIEAAEGVLDVRFSDERFIEIRLILLCTLMRIQAGKSLTELPEEYHHIIGTNEYKSVLEIFSKYNVSETLDKIYVVSLFQVASISNYSRNVFEEEVIELAAQVLANFEALTCVDFADREGLLALLIQHLRPAVYRIKYNYHVENNVLSMVLPRHSSLFELTKHSMRPLEEFVEKPISDEEVAYITILFGGWLDKSGKLAVVEGKKRAVVVCPNGVCISNVMFYKLKDAFPEFFFLDCLSVRKFQEYEHEYHLVFSSVPVETSKPLFIVKSVMDDMDVRRLRDKVFSSLMKSSAEGFDPRKIIEIISKHATIHDEKGLIKELKTYFDSTRNRAISSGEPRSKRLKSLLIPDHIRVSHEMMSWEEAVELASKPLLDDGLIEKRYITSIKDEIVENHPYLNIADGIMIAHSGIDKGVFDLGISLLKLPEPISIDGYLEADVIVVIATPDKSIHLPALMDLIDIVENESKLQALKHAESTADVLQIINGS